MSVFESEMVCDFPLKFGVSVGAVRDPFGISECGQRFRSMI